MCTYIIDWSIGEKVSNILIQGAVEEEVFSIFFFVATVTVSIFNDFHDVEVFPEWATAHSHPCYGLRIVAMQDCL